VTAVKRCAIYTRKSSEEGLKQEFNSLDAQRESCAAYVQSQAGEGWTLLPTVYDDGGYSGGNMDRPGLKGLMAEIALGRVDIVVVYKVDRLTRSLGDFSKMVEAFDAKSVSFVSVTQAFNTTTSMGRLTLNVLLSFAQFEREVTGERIRDKIAASKAKGLWMGGNVPMGYEAVGRTLRVVPEEAEVVRGLFRRYLELSSIHELRDEAFAAGIVSKVRVSAGGNRRGGGPLGRGALIHMLSNRAYLGQIPHKGVFHPGLHPPIVDPDLFHAVAAKLANAAGPKRRSRAGLPPLLLPSPLTGLLRDDRSNPMSPVTARGASGQLYRYYVSTAVQLGRRQDAGSLARVPASAIETLVLERVIGAAGRRDGEDPWDAARRALIGVELSRRWVKIVMSAKALDSIGLHKTPDVEIAIDGDQATLMIGQAVRNRGAPLSITGPDGASAMVRPTVNATLVKALARAESYRTKLAAPSAPTINDLAAREGVTGNYVRRLVRLAFLAPDLKRRILDGRQPESLSLETIMRADVPYCWRAQRQWFDA